MDERIFDLDLQLVADSILMFIVILILAVIFIGWAVPKNQLQAYTAHFFNKLTFTLWYIIMRYIAPLITIMILIAVSVEFFTGENIATFLFGE